MSKIVNSNFFCLVCLFLFYSCIPGYAQQHSQESRQPHKKIIEEVEVTNVELAVRVFSKGIPVSGLEKKDFQLFVNGKEKEIHGFYETRKNLETPANSPRVFLLIVNICDYHLDIENALDPLFDRIIKPNDHIILITNNFFVEDRHIPNPQEEKEKLKGILQLEAGKARHKLRILEQRLKSLLRLFKSRARHGNLDDTNAQDFVMDYIQLVQEFKNLYLDLGTDKYIRLAHHLKAQQGEKWVLSFYQVGRFFKPRFGSPFFKALFGGTDTSTVFGSFNAMQWYEKLRDAVEPGDYLPREDLAKLFTNTGATFHTILMEHGRTMQNELAADLSFVPIISDSYNLLKEISARTGGSFIDSNKFEKFYQKIAADDVYYVLTFVPDKEEAQKNNKIKITINDKTKKYRISYSNLKKGRYFEKAAEKVQKETETPHVRVERVSFKDNCLSFVVTNFKIKENDSPDQPAITKLPVRIQVFDQKSQSLFDGVKMFELTGKDLEGQKAKVRLQIDFPGFPPGIYDVLIWVGDPLTGKRDLAIKAITFPDNQ
ncbi:MAG: hypothetical protein JSV88_26370 [Candidatus Aminicenantes bacterium]|nr:MAG: hypothetical protein JSV88_26370 [Candidatus Aminicenantes bacterium]